MRKYFFPHAELMTAEAPDVIMAKIKNLENLKEEFYALNERRFKLEEMIEQEEKELNKIRGVLYDYIDEPENKETCPVQKSYILLQGVSNSKF